MYELCNKLFSDSIVFLTFIISLATILYMIFTILMWVTMKNSIDLSKQIFDSTNRPFIGVSEFSIQFTHNGLLNPFIRYSNFGTVPAKQLLLKIEYILNSKNIFSYEIELPNLFPKDNSIWGAEIQSEFLKNKLNPLDTFSFSLVIQYNGVTKTKHYTKELYKYDYKNERFSVTESTWN